jgi:hypothetical protein
MHQALELWGCEISAKLTVSLMAAYIVLSALAVIFIPKLSIRKPSGAPVETDAARLARAIGENDDVLGHLSSGPLVVQSRNIVTDCAGDLCAVTCYFVGFSCCTVRIASGP